MLKQDLILVTDMQKVYLKGEKWACKNINSAAGNIIRILNKCDCEVIFTAFAAPKNPIGQWKKYNSVNDDVNSCPEKSEIIEKFKRYTEKYPLLLKDKYSSLSNSKVREAAKKTINNGGRVVLTGVVSECCVLSTAMAAIDIGCKVIYLRDAVAGSNRKSEKAAELIMQGMEPVHAEIMTAWEYLEEQNR